MLELYIQLLYRFVERIITTTCATGMDGLLCSPP